MIRLTKDLSTRTMSPSDNIPALSLWQRFLFFLVFGIGIALATTFRGCSF